MKNEHECIDYFLTQDNQLLENFLPPSKYQIELRLIFSKNQGPRTNYPPTLGEYELIKVLGTGGFSQVLMVRKLSTGKLFAMKVINKKHILDQDKVDQIISERKILTSAAADHPFMVQLHCAFTSRSNLYLVLDLCSGGELFYYISKVHGRFSERQAKLCFAELLLALERLHSQGVLYRDMKPENVLVDAEGHLRLTDFGLSKQGLYSQVDLTQTFCGSPEYMAPEMLRQGRPQQYGIHGHGLKLDFYQLGALLFEMLTGLPPFYTSGSNARIKMYQDIMGPNKVSLPRDLSADAVDLMRKLLEKDPQRRLTDFVAIKNHPFCREIDWEKVFRREEEAPLKVAFNQSNFDKQYTSMPITINAIEEDYDYSRGQGMMRRTKSLTDMADLTGHHVQLQAQEDEEVEPFEQAEKYHPQNHDTYNNAGIPPWQQVHERTVTPTFKEFLYKRVSQQVRDRADSNAHQRIFRLGATQKVVAPSLEADNFLVESIIEDDFQYQTRKKSVEEELPITIFIQEDFAPVSPTDFKKQRSTKNRDTTGRHRSLQRRDSVMSEENSPAPKESARVQRVIEENFNWTKQNQGMMGHWTGKRTSDQLGNERTRNSQGGSSSIRVPDLRKCPSSKKKINIFQQFIDIAAIQSAKNLNGIVPFQESVSSSLNLERKLSAAKIITFTEKANGIISERNRDVPLYQMQVFPTEEDDAGEEQDEYRVNNRSTPVKVALNQNCLPSEVSRISERFEGEHSSESAMSNQHLSEECASSLHFSHLHTGACERPATKIVQHKCQAKDTGMLPMGGLPGSKIKPKLTLQKKTPNDSFLLGSQIMGSQSQNGRPKVHHSSQSSVSMSGYSSKLIAEKHHSRSSSQLPNQGNTSSKGEACPEYLLYNQGKDMFSLASNSSERLHQFSQKRAANLSIRTSQQTLHASDHFDQPNSSQSAYQNSHSIMNRILVSRNDEFRTDNFDSLNVRGLTTPECPALTNMSHEGKIHIENLDAFNQFKSMHQAPRPPLDNSSPSQGNQGRDFSVGKGKRSPRESGLLFSNKKAKRNEQTKQSLDVQPVAQTTQVLISPRRPSQPFGPGLKIQKMQLTQSRKPAQVTPKQSRASEVKKVMSNKPSAKIDSTLSVVPQSTRAIRGDARSNNGQSTARSLSKPGASSRGEFSGQKTKFFRAPLSTQKSIKMDGDQSKQPGLQVLLEESRTQFKVDPTQTLRKIDIVNRDKQPKAPLKKSVAESKLQERSKGPQHPPIGFVTHFPGSQAQEPPFNRSDINTMQSSVTEFDVENFEELHSYSSLEKKERNTSSQYMISDSSSMVQPSNYPAIIIQEMLTTQGQSVKNQGTLPEPNFDFSAKRKQASYKEPESQYMVGSAPRTHKSSTFKRKGTDFKGSQINRDNSLQRREEAPTARNPVSVERAAPLSPTRKVVDAKSEYSGKSDGKSSRGTNQYQAFSGKKYLGKLTSPSIQSKPSLQSPEEPSPEHLERSALEPQQLHSLHPGSSSYLLNMQTKLTQLRTIALQTQSDNSKRYSSNKKPSGRAANTSSISLLSSPSNPNVAKK